MLHCPTLRLLWVIGACQSAYSCHHKKKSVARNNFKTTFRFLPEYQKKLLFVGCKGDESSLSAICEKSFNLSLQRLSVPVLSAYPGLVCIFWVINCFWFGLLPLQPVYFSFAHNIEFVMFCMSAYHWGRKHHEKMSQVGSRRSVADRIWNF